MFNNFFQIEKKPQSITLAAFLIFLSTLISRILGLLRDRLLADRFGASAQLDVYFAAFRIPDFVYGLVVAGGLISVFLPVFAEYYQKSRQEGWELANNVLNVFLVILFSLSFLLAFLTPWLMNLIAPGFSPEQKILAAKLTRIMFLSPIFFGLSSVFSGILHYFDRFLAFSLAPIIYNLGIIFGILFLLPFFGVFGVAFGVILGAFLHWLIQVPFARMLGFRYSPIFNFKSSPLLKVFKLMTPRLIGSAAYYINLILLTAVASTLPEGTISIFNFANNLQYFPIGLIGIPFATAIFPVLSRSWAERDKKRFLDYFSLVFRRMLFLVVPASVLIFILRSQIVQLILGTGEFDRQAISLTSAVLGIFSLGIFVFTFIPFLVRVFYSLQDTKTPAFLSVFSVILNFVLVFFLLWLFNSIDSFRNFLIDLLNLERGDQKAAVIVLPLAISLAGIFQFSFLLFFLKRRMGKIDGRKILSSFSLISLITLLMVFIVYLTLNFLTFSFNPFIQLSLSLVSGLFVYLLFSLFFLRNYLR
jgi:putative peptidoglycan lipid II flippase